MEPYIGEIRLFAGNYAPVGWALCDGQTLPVAQNDVLFSILGTNYGGDGRTTFCLPKIAPVKSNGSDIKYIIALQGIYPSRS